MNVYEQLGIEPFVNAAGRLTALGGSVLRSAVAEAMADAGRRYIDLAALKAAAGRRIAEYCGAEAGYVTSGAAAGVALMVAAVVAGRDPARISDLPDSTEPNAILVQTGHLINFGAPIRQMIRLGGGRVVPVGSANQVKAPELQARLRAQPVAGVLYVQSHHAVQKGMLPLREVVAIAAAEGVPVLVDAAAEEDLRRYVALGSDLVTYSGGKAFEGPTSGFIVGRRDLIEACVAQEAGIGRPMKVGKEAIVGLLAALEQHVRSDPDSTSRGRRAITTALLDGLRSVPQVSAGEEPDEAGRDIVRVRLAVTPGAGFTLGELVAAMHDGSPPIAVRPHHLDEGWVTLDPRTLAADQVELLVQRVREIVDDLSNRKHTA